MAVKGASRGKVQGEGEGGGGDEGGFEGEGGVGVEGEGDLSCRPVACVVDAATAADVGEHRDPQDGCGGHDRRWL